MAPSPLIRIGYDATSTVGPRTGIGVGTAHLLSALAREIPDTWQIDAFVNSAKHPLPDDPWTRADNVSVHHHRLPGRPLMRAWQYLKFPPIEKFTGPVSLHHSPASYIPPTRNAPIVLTIHDLYFLHAPETRDPYGGGYFHATFPKGLHRVDKIISVSEFTKAEAIREYGIEEEKIRVIYHGLDAGVFNQTVAPGESEWVEKWTQGEPFLLSVADLNPRKNLPALIEGYAKALAEEPALPKLVLIGGNENTEAARALDEAIVQANVADKIIRTGYIDGTRIPAFYRAATAFVFPSLCEGFGIPVIEAMACGCPVVAANAGALPEVCGDAGLMMDIGTMGGIANAILEIMRDAQLRDRLIEKGRDRAATFMWGKAARETINVYRELIE